MSDDDMRIAQYEERMRQAAIDGFKMEDFTVEIGDETFKVSGMDDASPDDQRQACMMAFAMCAALGMAVVEQGGDITLETGQSVSQITTVLRIIGEDRFYDFARKSLRQAGIPC